MSEELKRDAILGAGPDDGDWTDVLRRTKRATRRYQVRAAVLLTALVVVGAASAYALTHRGQPWCKAPTSDTWRKVLASHVVTLSRRASVEPIALASDGHSFYATLFTKSYYGVVLIDVRTSRYKEIKRIPRSDQVVGNADGRWLVWTELVNGYGATRAIWAWDSRRDRLHRITRSMRSADGWWAGSWTPAVSGNYAAWSQSASVGERAGVHVVNLLNGRDKVVNSSGSGQFLLPGHVVAWTENVSALGGKNPSYILEAANFISGRRVSLPKPLRDLPSQGAATLVSDGRSFVYSAERTPESLWWSPSLETAAWHVFTLKNEASAWIENPVELAGHYVLFGAQTNINSSYLVDARTHGYVRLDRIYAGPLSEDAVIFDAPTVVKSAHPVDAVYFIPATALPPIRSCPKPVTVPR